MALANQFSNVTTATGAQLDANFQTVGLLGVIPCSATGTNAITLSLLNSSNAPTVSSYANYYAFSFVASATNTGPTTLQVGTLAALNVYKNSSSGPVALSGGEIVANSFYTVFYNSALNGGSGGFQVTEPVVASSYMSSNVASGSPVALTSGTVSTITHLDLTPGTWDVTMQAVFDGGTATTISNLQVGLATVGTISATPGFFNNIIGASGALLNFGAAPTNVCGPSRFTVPSTLTTLTVYALADAVFGGSSLSVYGLMSARRSG